MKILIILEDPTLDHFILSAALKPHERNYTLVFDTSDDRTEDAVELAEDGHLSNALHELQSITPVSAGVQYDLAMVHLGLGDTNNAIRNFEAAHRAGLKTGISTSYLKHLNRRREYERRYPHPTCWFKGSER